MRKVMGSLDFEANLKYDILCVISRFVKQNTRLDFEVLKGGGKQDWCLGKYIGHMGSN